MSIPSPTAFIGCDVGKASIVVFDSRTGRTYIIANLPAELRRFAESLDATCLVICEATGGYEAALLDAMVQAGRAIHRADARKVKAFIRSFGILGKTDRIDARALTLYGEERHARLALWQPHNAARERLHQLVLLRGDLLASQTAWGNRSQAPGGPALAAHIEPVLVCLRAQISAVETEIQRLLNEVASLRRQAEALRAVPGLGPHSVAALLALMPELGQLTRRRATALAGLAPHPDASATLERYRRVRGGRPEVKRMLFLAAMAAAKHNPALRAFHQRLRANGKKPMVALVAVMRKLVVMANAILRDLTSPAETGCSLVRSG